MTARKALDSLRERCRRRRWTSGRRPRWPTRSVASSNASSSWRAAARARDVRPAIAPTCRTGCTTRRWPAACGRSPTASRASRAWCATSARSLGKQVRLEIVGETTQVDRDMLAKLDAPLGHLLRNAVDHGIESPDERRAAGKPAEGVVRLEARHSAGALHVIVSDDGRGVDLDKLRRAVVEREADRHARPPRALSEAELLEFLFLPGFTMKDDGHRNFRPRRRPRRRAGHGQAGARHGARVVAARQRHALPAAAAGDALGGPRAAGRDRRRALRVSARAHRAHAEAAEGQDRAARRPAAFRLRRPADRPRRGAPGAGAAEPRSPATSCR